jgi:hypothetical protein
MILKRSVGQGEVCVCGDAGQGATTRNSQLFQGVATPPWAAQACNSPCSVTHPVGEYAYRTLFL